MSKICPLESNSDIATRHRSGSFSVNTFSQYYKQHVKSRLIYADYACKMGSTSSAREDIFRTPIADKKTVCDHQIKVVGYFCGEKRTRPWHVSWKIFNSE